MRGSGKVWIGPCKISFIIFWPDTGADYVDIYDGRDATDGKKFCRIECAGVSTCGFCFDESVEFDEGIYVKDNDEGTETTVVFTPLERD
jgi:hypothetical protein